MENRNSGDQLSNFFIVFSIYFLLTDENKMDL